MASTATSYTPGTASAIRPAVSSPREPDITTTRRALEANGVMATPTSGRMSSTGSIRPRQLATPTSHTGAPGSRVTAGRDVTSATSAMATAKREPPRRSSTPPAASRGVVVALHREGHRHG